MHASLVNWMGLPKRGVTVIGAVTHPASTSETSPISVAVHMHASLVKWIGPPKRGVTVIGAVMHPALTSETSPISAVAGVHASRAIIYNLVHQAHLLKCLQDPPQHHQ